VRRLHGLVQGVSCMGSRRHQQQPERLLPKALAAAIPSQQPAQVAIAPTRQVTAVATPSIGEIPADQAVAAANPHCSTGTLSGGQGSADTVSARQGIATSGQVAAAQVGGAAVKVTIAIQGPTAESQSPPTAVMMASQLPPVCAGRCSTSEDGPAGLLGPRRPGETRPSGAVSLQRGPGRGSATRVATKPVLARAQRIPGSLRREPGMLVRPTLSGRKARLEIWCNTGQTWGSCVGMGAPITVLQLEHSFIQLEQNELGCCSEYRSSLTLLAAPDTGNRNWFDGRLACTSANGFRRNAGAGGWYAELRARRGYP
jgi:hypothetical protein